MSVIIFGSINMDLVVRAPHFPQPGESEIGSTFFTAPGGKGSNQAVACAKLGVPTKMIGRIGNDVFADYLVHSLQVNGVDTSCISSDPSQPSGTALITLNDEGENAIVYVPGANSRVGNEELSHLEKEITKAKLLLLQLEIPMSVTLEAARIARQHNVPILLDPAPAQPIPSELYRMIEIITPNETEAAYLAGFPIHDIHDAEQAVDLFHNRGCHQVIIKMGGKGAFYSNGERQVFLPAYQVQAIDTVAAGDAFNGALAAALYQDIPLQEALNWGMAAGALSATKTGAQPSLPTLAELRKFLVEKSSS